MFVISLCFVNQVEEYVNPVVCTLKVKEVVSQSQYAEVLEPYPFNSGYFMCVRMKQALAEPLRRRLLEEHGVGVIALGENDLRIAFSCLEAEQVKDLFDILYIAAKDAEVSE